MPEGQQDHGRVPVTVAVRLGGFDQGVDLPGRGVAPFNSPSNPFAAK
jgi:hypothetical protein